MTNINTCIPSMEILHAYDQNHIIAKCSIGAILHLFASKMRKVTGPIHSFLPLLAQAGAD